MPWRVPPARRRRLSKGSKVRANIDRGDFTEHTLVGVG
jgi:hypothetical protein